MIITADVVFAWGPCDSNDTYSLENLHKILGCCGMSPLQIIDGLPGIPKRDKIWCLARPEVLGDRNSRLLACDYADHVLPIYEARFPEDNRFRHAIEVSRAYAYAEGKSLTQELEEARVAAAAATGATARVAAAARVAAEVARAAAWTAAGAAAELEWQLQKLREYITGGDMDG
jgi:hypothetical protein